MFDATFFAASPDAPTAGPLPGDDKLFVHFYRRAAHNERRSQEAGRPIFDEVEMVRIVVPGARDEVDKPVTDAERSRFGAKYQLFRTAGAAAAPAGTPLEEWPGLSVSQIAELRAVGVTTVEALAGLSTDQAARFPNGVELVARAAAFLEHAQDSSTVTRLAAENARLRAQLAAAAAEVAQLTALVAQLQETGTHAL